MQSAVLISLLLIWSSAVDSAPAEEAPTPPEFTLGDKVFKKQDECEGVISDTIDEILDDENSDLHDFPIADESYHDCKEALDKLKREYMSANHIEKSTYPEFFPIKLGDGSLELISVPAEEGAERRDLEFDVNEELCVTGRKCARILDMIDGEKEKEDLYKIRFAHCSVLLDDIKLKYIREKELDMKKLKEDGGMSIVCTGRSILLPLPHAMNNLDYYQQPPQDIFSELPLGDAPGSTTEDTSLAGKELYSEENEDEREGTIPTSEGDKHEHKHVEPAKETAKDVKGPSSNAFVVKANFVSCVIAIVVFGTIV